MGIGCEKSPTKGLNNINEVHCWTLRANDFLFVFCKLAFIIYSQVYEITTIIYNQNHYNFLKFDW